MVVMAEHGPQESDGKSPTPRAELPEEKAVASRFGQTHGQPARRQPRSPPCPPPGPSRTWLLPWTPPGHGCAGPRPFRGAVRGAAGRGRAYLAQQRGLFLPQTSIGHRAPVPVQVRALRVSPESLRVFRGVFWAAPGREEGHACAPSMSVMQSCSQLGCLTAVGKERGLRPSPECGRKPG